MFLSATTNTILTPHPAILYFTFALHKKQRKPFHYIKTTALIFLTFHFLSMHFLQLWVQLRTVENKDHQNVCGKKKYLAKGNIWKCSQLKSISLTWNYPECDPDSSINTKFQRETLLSTTSSRLWSSIPCRLVPSWPPQHQLLLCLSLGKVKQKPKKALKTTSPYQGNYRSHPDHTPSLEQWNHWLKQRIAMGSWTLTKTKQKLLL